MFMLEEHYAGIKELSTEWRGDYFETVVAVNATPASDVFYGTDVDDDVKVITPPFPTMWIERKISKAHEEDRADWAYRVGCMVKTTSMETTGPLLKDYIARARKRGTDMADAPDDAKWSSEWSIFLENKRGSLYLVAAALVLIREDGSPIERFIGGIVDKNTREAFEKVYPDIQEREDESIGLIYDMIRPFWYCITLMHAKNIVLNDRPIADAVRKRRARERKPCIAFKELKLRVGKDRLEPLAQHDTTGIKMAAHIRRGHFSDHTEHGLFGRESLKGIYWVPMHMAGRNKIGQVEKSYSVLPPDA